MNISPQQEFQSIVEAKADGLRALSWSELLIAGDEPEQCVEVQGRCGSINNIVEEVDDGSLRVVVQGFLRGRFLRFWMNVALDGFYKRVNGDVEQLADEEYYEFD